MPEILDSNTLSNMIKARLGGRCKAGGAQQLSRQGRFAKKQRTHAGPKCRSLAQCFPANVVRRVLRVTSECVRVHPHLRRVVPTYLHDRPASCMHSFLPSRWGFKGAPMTSFIHHVCGSRAMAQHKQSCTLS